MNGALALASCFSYNNRYNPSFDGGKNKSLKQQTGQSGDRIVTYCTICTAIGGVMAYSKLGSCSKQK